FPLPDQLGVLARRRQVGQREVAVGRPPDGGRPALQEKLKPLIPPFDHRKPPYVGRVRGRQKHVPFDHGRKFGDILGYGFSGHLPSLCSLPGKECTLFGLICEGRTAPWRKKEGRTEAWGLRNRLPTS